MGCLNTALSAQAGNSFTHVDDISPKEYQTWLLLLNLLPQGTLFKGKLGPGILSYPEFSHLVTKSQQNGSLKKLWRNIRLLRDGDSFAQFLRQKELL